MYRDSPKDLAAPAIESTNVLTPCPVEIRSLVVPWERRDLVTLASQLLQGDDKLRGLSLVLHCRHSVDVGI